VGVGVGGGEVVGACGGGDGGASASIVVCQMSPRVYNRRYPNLSTCQ